MYIINEGLIFSYIKAKWDYERIKFSDDFCAFCDRSVDVFYVYIIKTLRENGLLRKDYKLRCCMCNIIIERPEFIRSVHEVNTGVVDVEKFDVTLTINGETIIRRSFRKALKLKNCEDKRKFIENIKKKFLPYNKI